jgi:hypothetical protein
MIATKLSKNHVSEFSKSKSREKLKIIGSRRNTRRKFKLGGTHPKALLKGACNRSSIEALKNLK